MRLNQFLDKLAMTPRTWFLSDDGLLRSQVVGTTRVHCPISAVAEDMGLPDSVHGAAVGSWLGPEMGLSEDTTVRLMDTADDDPRYPTLRRRLLRKCGLTKAKVRRSAYGSGEGASVEARPATRDILVH